MRTNMPDAPAAAAAAVTENPSTEQRTDLFKYLSVEFRFNERLIKKKEKKIFKVAIGDVSYLISFSRKNRWLTIIELTLISNMYVNVLYIIEFASLKFNRLSRTKLRQKSQCFFFFSIFRENASERLGECYSHLKLAMLLYNWFKKQSKQFERRRKVNRFIDWCAHNDK